MNYPNSLIRFLQNLQITHFILPDQTRYWQLSSVEVTDLKKYAAERFTLEEHHDFPKEVFIWQEGPVLYEGVWGDGVVFENLEVAYPYLYKLREYLFTSSEWYVYFALSREDVEQILGKLEYNISYLHPSNPITEETKPIITLERPFGYLIEGPNLWFATEAHVRRFEDYVAKIDGML